MTIRIGILKTDSVREEYQAEFGDYPVMFRTLLSLPGEPVTFADYNVEHGHYPATTDECDAWLITGSRRSVYEDEPWILRLRDYVVELNDTRSKLIGICFGHQLVAHALGGRTESAKLGWRVGVHPNTVVRRAPFMAPAVDTFNLIFSHKDQVTELPAGAEALASSPGCPISMFRIGDHILTFQGHPEFCKGYSRSLMEFRQDILGEPTFSSGMASLAASTDETAVSQWILNFIASPAAFRPRDAASEPGAV
ncbi:MAG TPA: amidotransferase [Pseudomonadales bacterium]|nr:amidotransferase [Pseudomonadales bacterium]